MFRNTLKLMAVEASMLMLAFTVRSIAAEQNIQKSAEQVHTVAFDNMTDERIQPERAETEIPEKESTPFIIGSRDWGAEDDEFLLKIAMAEAEGESTEGKALVMLVVLNRVWSDGFPDSIEAVIFEKNQFSVTLEGGRYYSTTPNEDCYKALELVKNGWDESQGALYFESCDGENWHSKELEFLYQVGKHRFYR